MSWSGMGWIKHKTKRTKGNITDLMEIHNVSGTNIEICIQLWSHLCHFIVKSLFWICYTTKLLTSGHLNHRHSFGMDNTMSAPCSGNLDCFTISLYNPKRRTNLPLPLGLGPGVVHALKLDHFDEIDVTGYTKSCQNDNFRCSQWWIFLLKWHHFRFNEGLPMAFWNYCDHIKTV